MVTVNNDPRCATNEAQSFGSFAIALQDDEAAVLNLPVDYGHVFVAESSTSNHGMAWIRGSSAVKYFGGANFDVLTNTVLSGITGADGKLTISSNGSKCYIENRTGAAINISMTFLGMATNRI
ncbi:hypothetical protein ES815_21925 [Leclercia adecarboxylata]|uniref:Uncharacterized protein n=1 Tax=Leclercia adecarboxylata TaxID=83655 RepID=A0AAP9DDF0_9ENTR|nr:hypothetical protein [Leclercia adecarboxylata]QDK20824.1 hypothetical protein ES815_21925 [Leclercia adecarboxylata]